jgi:ketosteroid isomerase-like protein
MLSMSSNREIIATLYRHFENKDIAAVSEIVAEDIVMDLPYSPEGYPKRLIGKKDFTHHMESGLAAYAKVKFINMRFWDMADPGLISVQFQGETELPSGSRYSNDYFCMFEIREGKLHSWLEYYNPLVALEAFGGVAAFSKHYGH